MAEQFANTVVKIGATTIAKITSVRYAAQMAEVDITGAEDVSGNLVQQDMIPVSIGRTLALEGITVEGVAAEYEAGQSALKAAAEAGTEVVVEHTKPSGYGSSYTGYFTSYNESGAAQDVYKFTADFRINAVAAVTP